MNIWLRFSFWALAISVGALWLAPATWGLRTALVYFHLSVAFLYSALVVLDWFGHFTKYKTSALWLARLSGYVLSVLCLAVVLLGFNWFLQDGPSHLTTLGHRWGGLFYILWALFHQYSGKFFSAPTKK